MLTQYIYFEYLRAVRCNSHRDRYLLHFFVKLPCKKTKIFTCYLPFNLHKAIVWMEQSNSSLSDDFDNFRDFVAGAHYVDVDPFCCIPFHNIKPVKKEPFFPFVSIFSDRSPSRCGSALLTICSGSDSTTVVFFRVNPKSFNSSISAVGSSDRIWVIGKISKSRFTVCNRQWTVLT